MKTNRNSVLMLGMLMATMLMAAFSFTSIAEAKGLVQKVALSGSTQYANAKGTAKYKVDGNEREFQVEIENIKSLAGKTLSVFVDGKKIGSFRVTRLGAGRLNRNTDRGQFVPTISSGTKIEVKTKSGALVASGRF